MRMFVSFLLMLFFSFLSAYVAKKRGRNPTAWFAICVLFGIFAPIILMILKPINGKQEKSIFLDPMDDEDIEVKPIALSLTEQYSLKDWFYMDSSHTQQGPLSLLQMEKLWKDQKINKNTYVWSEGMTDWKYIKDVAGLQDSLA